MMKYLVLRYEDTDREEVHLFPKSITHKDYARTIVTPGWNPVRAGFVTIINGKPHAFGDSFSMGLVADRERDSQLIANSLEGD